MKPRTVINIYAIIVLLMILPFIIAQIALTIARFMGITISETSGVSAHVIVGRDIGPFLGGTAMIGWFSLLTVPSGLVALVVFTVIVLLLRKKGSGTTEADQ
jgi:hypothetical protein